MEWHIRADLPIYAQLIFQIKLAIVSGEYLPGERLASVRELAMDAGVNPNTMQRALQELEREGMVYTQRTSGRFVTEDTKVIESAKKHLAEDRIKDFLEQMGRLGYPKEEILSLLKASIEEEKNNADMGM
ncbi:MAG: GntR family transcriptional regulator [Clostridiales bacterium]|nr:GntR family transcriptional regulator [Clostridiales bacterium]